MLPEVVALLNFAPVMSMRSSPIFPLIYFGELQIFKPPFALVLFMNHAWLEMFTMMLGSLKPALPASTL